SCRESHGQNVTGGVDIAVMAHATDRTCPLTYIQRERLKNMPARRAGLTGGVPAVNLDDCASVPLGFVLQLAHKPTPTNITDRFRQAVILQHALDVECFQTDHLVFADQFGGHLMLKIPAGIGYASMQLCHFFTGFLAVLAALFLACVLALCLRQLLLIPCI